MHRGTVGRHAAMPGALAMSEQGMHQRRTPIRRAVVNDMTFAMQGVVRGGQPTVLVNVESDGVTTALLASPEEIQTLAEALMASALDAAEQVP